MSEINTTSPDTDVKLQEYAEKLNKLRENGVNKVLYLEQEIATTKKSKIISADEKQRLLTSYRAELVEAQKVAAANKAEEKRVAKEAVAYNNKISKTYIAKVVREENDKLSSLKKEYNTEVSKIKSEFSKEIEALSKKYSGDELKEEVTNMVSDKINNALRIKDKLEKYAELERVKEECVTYYEEKYNDLDKDELTVLITKVRLVMESIEYDLFRKIVVNEHTRADGRAMDEIRPLSTDIDLLPRTHGSALFTRGQTQSLSVTTLGALGEHQILDGLGIEDEKRFMLHYNFPQFSVGETGRYGAPGRREIGHGALGERALLQVIPSEEEFPYTIRVVSEILESNGSSSQASICAGCMSLMAAGVPIKAPVAGIAMGLITNGDDYTILTDIQGMEDHLGDMDFKVAGTKDGICALQMDIKIKGITREIFKEALAQAKKARLEILEVIKAQIPEPRKEVSKYAPKTVTFTIDPNRIKEVIGKGGETITKIILESSNVKTVNDINAVKVDLEDDGRVIIYHTDSEIIEKCANMIKDIVKEVEEGVVYDVKVVKVEDFGCFVQLWPGCEGLVHVSQLDTKRVEKPSDLVKVGDIIQVKSMGYDKRGRLNLSRKEVLKDMEEAK